MICRQVVIQTYNFVKWFTLSIILCLIKLLQRFLAEKLSVMQPFGKSMFHTVVRWHKLRMVESKCTLHNFIVLAIFTPKIIKFSENLTKLWQKQFWLFFSETRCRDKLRLAVWSPELCATLNRTPVNYPINHSFEAPFACSEPGNAMQAISQLVRIQWRRNQLTALEPIQCTSQHRIVCMKTEHWWKCEDDNKYLIRFRHLAHISEPPFLIKNFHFSPFFLLFSSIISSYTYLKTSSVHVIN